jgi:hypothetical protein
MTYGTTSAMKLDAVTKRGVKKIFMTFISLGTLYIIYQTNYFISFEK